MRRMTVLVALLLLAGCSAKDGPATVPTPSGEYQQALAFSKCMREHGLPDFPDPAPDGSLDASNAKVDRNSTQYKNAIQACQALRPGGNTQSSTDPQQLAQMTKFAACMREHGMPEFPDPGPDGFEAGAFDTADPAFAGAQDACQEFLTWR